MYFLLSTIPKKKISNVLSDILLERHNFTIVNTLFHNHSTVEAFWIPFFGQIYDSIDYLGELKKVMADF